MSAPAAVVATYNRIKAALLENYPELADDAETLTDTLDGLHAGQDMVARLVRQSIEDKASVSALKELEATYAGRRSRLSARSEHQRDAAFDLMEALGERKITRPEFTLSISKGRSSVVISNPDILPNEYWRRPSPEPDKTKIGDALAAGQDVPGATLSNSPEKLTVRIK